MRKRSKKKSHSQAEDEQRQKSLRCLLKGWVRETTANTSLISKLERDIDEAGLAKLCGLEHALRPFIEAAANRSAAGSR